MKWLFLIVRHFWPRRYWTEVRREAFYSRRIIDGILVDPAPRGPSGYYVTLRDQFGNQKTYVDKPQ